MCGIAGLILPAGVGFSDAGLKSRLGLDELSMGMLSLMRHRGPDGAGRILGGAGFAGNVRLSIVDLAGGAQPIANEDGTIWIVYNGEIYDVADHRLWLEERGHRFATRTDTEVLVHLYEELGDAFVSRINGEYAFALYDGREQKWLLARDPFGVRPLYYRAFRSEALLFASEIKPLLWAAGDSSVYVSPQALAQTLQGWAVVPPETSVKGVYQLPPGTCMSVDRNGRRTQRDFFDLPSPQSLPAPEHVRALVGRAVQRRLVADVPIGIYLSGGLDSSIVALESLAGSRHPTHSFSIRFEDDQFDEGAEQDVVQKQLGTQHHVVHVGNAEIRKHFTDAVLSAESVVFRSAFVPMFLLSQEVHRSGIRTVLTGEGADELFGGYDIFRELKLLRYWARQPESKRRPKLLSRLYPYLPQFQGANVEKLVPFYRSLLGQHPTRFYGHEGRWRNYVGVTRLLRESVAAPIPTALAAFQRFENADIWESCRQAEMLTLLHGYLLSTQGDRMAAAHSVETRLPFLDQDVARLALSVPLAKHISGLREKSLLHRAYDAHLPERIARKRKTPFLAPDAEIFINCADQSWRDYLSGPAMHQHPLIDARAAQGMLDGLSGQIARKQAVSRRDNTAFFSLLSARILEEHLLDGCRDYRRIALDKDLVFPQ